MQRFIVFQMILFFQVFLVICFGGVEVGANMLAHYANINEEPYIDYINNETIRQTKKGDISEIQSNSDNVHSGQIRHKYSGSEATDLYNLAMSFFEKKDYSNALDMFNQLIQRFPESKYVDAAYFHLGLIYSKKRGYFCDALAYFDLLKSYYPKSPYVRLSYLYKGEMFYEMGKFKEAKRLLEEFIKFSPKDPKLKEAKIFLAKTLFRIGWYQQAKEVFIELERKYPDFYLEDPEALYLMGENYFLLKEYKKAIPCLFHVLNVYPRLKENNLILARIADCYNYQGQKKTSIKLFKLTKALYPDTEGALVAKMRLLEKADTVTKLNGYRSIVETKPRTPLSQLAMFKLATTFYDKAEYKKCIDVLKKMMQTYPTSLLSDNIRYLLEKSLLKQIKHYTSQKEYIKVINFYFRNKQLFSKVKNPICFLYLGNAFKEMELYDQAIKIYYMVDNLFWKEGRDEWLFSLGYSYFKKHSYDLAKEKFQEIISSYPQSRYKKQALLYLGKCFYFLGNDEKAKKFLSEAIKTFKDPSDLCEVYSCLGDIFLRQKNYTKALNFYKKALKLGEDKKILSSIFYKIGKCYLGLHREEKAIEAFNKVKGGLFKKMATLMVTQIDITRKLREFNGASGFIE